MCVIRISEGGKKEKSRIKIQKIIAEDFSHLILKKKNPINLHIQKLGKLKSKMEKHRNPHPNPEYSRCWKTKDKEKILRTEREKWLLTDTRNPNNRTADFPSETMAYRRQWDDIYETLEVGSRELFRFPIIFQK